MRIRIIENDREGFNKAMPQPEDDATNENIGSYTLEKLEDATARKEKSVSFQSVDMNRKRSGNFEKCNAALKPIVWYLAHHEFPKTVRIVCEDHAAAEMYRMVYNFYYAGTKDERL